MAKSSGKYRWAFTQLQEGKTVYFGGVAFKVMRHGTGIYKRVGNSMRASWRKFGDNEKDEWRRVFEHKRGYFVLEHPNKARR